MAKAPLQNTKANRRRERYNIILCLLSRVIANTPVNHCAIVKSVHKAHTAKYRAKGSTHGELLLFSFMKVPCAINYAASKLHCDPEQRTRAEWLRVLEEAIIHYKADRTFKDKNLDEMHPKYRHHRANVANGIETTTGLLYMRKLLMTKYSDESFKAAKAFEPDWATSIEDIAK